MLPPISYFTCPIPVAAAAWFLLPAMIRGALSSVNEGESRHFARLVEIPLLEPGNFQEAKDMTKWAFELSEEIKSVVMLRKRDPYVSRERQCRVRTTSGNGVARLFINRMDSFLIRMKDW